MNSGYYKSKGLEFINGDQLSSGARVVDMVLYNRDVDKCVDYCHLDKPVEFAWRTNTGEQPCYTGAIDIEFRSGQLIQGCVDKRRAWRLGDITSDIIKWRPTPQSNKNTVEEVVSAVIGSDELVYTQEMADNSIYPKAGMRFLGKHFPGDKYKEVEALFDNEDVVYVREKDGVAHYHFSKLDKDCSFKPLKSEDELLRDKLKAILVPFDTDEIAVEIMELFKAAK